MYGNIRLSCNVLVWVTKGSFHRVSPSIFQATTPGGVFRQHFKARSVFIMRLPHSFTLTDTDALLMALHSTRFKPERLVRLILIELLFYVKATTSATTFTLDTYYCPSIDVVRIVRGLAMVKYLMHMLSRRSCGHDWRQQTVACPF